jgi:hypothetical protein
MSHTNNRTSGRTAAVRSAVAPVAETLERRRLLCGIHDDGADDAELGMWPVVGPGAGTDAPAVSAAPHTKVPLSSVPNLSSRSGASVKVFLDFDGDNIANWGWNSKATPAQPYHPGAIPAYDSDGDPTTFDDATEIPNIRKIWDTVAEKFSPFNVDVTTIDPGNLNDGQTFKMVIGGTNAWYGSGGGVAYVNAFTNSNPNIGFVFSQGRAADITFCGAGAAHEIGHAFGLEHQGITSNGTVTTEYSSGSGGDVPIMGNANNTPSRRGIWFNGEANNRDGSNNLVALGPQDDIAIMTDGHNNFGYAADDHPAWDTPTITVTSNGAFAPARGIIERTTDTDVWRFSATTNRGTFSISSWANGGMLRPSASLTTAGGNPVNASVYYNNGQITIDTSNMVAGGLYQIAVSSASAYGEIGQYQINGQMQTFAAFDSSTGTLNINGILGNNNLRLYMDYGTTAQVVVENTINGSTGSQSFAAAPIKEIDVLLGNGNDTLQVEPLANWAGGPAIHFDANLGGNTGGDDTLKIQAYNAIKPFDVWSDLVTFDPNMFVHYKGAERLELLGTNTGDQFNIREMGLDTHVHAYGYGGSDTMTIYPLLVRTLGTHTWFHGGSNFGGGDVDTLKVDATAPGDQIPAGMDVIEDFDGHITVNTTGYARDFHFDTDVEALSLIGGDASEAFTVYSLPSYIKKLDVDMGQGNDHMNVGWSYDDPAYSTPFSDAVKGAINVIGGDGTDSIYIDDLYALSSPSYALTNTKLSSSGGGSVTCAADVESMVLDGKQAAGCTYAVNGSPSATATTLNAGNGGDSITVTGSGGALTIDAGGGTDALVLSGGLITSLTARGGSDANPDVLTVDDRTLGANMSGGFVYADRIRRSTDTQSVIYYSGFSSVNWYQKDNQNLVSVYGVSADIAPNKEFWIGGGSADDYVEVYPRDGAGNPTVNGNLSFNGGGGGADTLRLFTTGADPAFYQVYGRIGTNDVFIGSAAPRWIGATPGVENVAIYGSTGNDVFRVDQYKAGSALSVFGGGGNDTCTIGNGNLAANITNISAFTFDGQNGNVTSFVVDNAATTDVWNYRINDPSLIASESSGYFVSLSARNIKSQKILSGSAGDIFDVDTVDPGVETELRGDGGLKWMRMGSNSGTVQTIRGKVSFLPGSGGGYMQIGNNLDSTADTVHLTANTLGAYAGDNLFGAGGSLVFDNIVNGAGSDPGIYLSLSSGTNTVYALPLASARVTINSHPFFVSPSGSIKLALAGVSNPVISGDAVAGSLTSSNRQTLNWNRFAGTIATDAVAPAMVGANINLDGVPAAPRQSGPSADPAAAAAGNQLSLDVRFSEDVSGLLSTSWLELTHVTSNTLVARSNIAASYDSSTNTAHFTFPGYPNGVLFDGNYRGRILAGLPDFFGNALPADASFDFFVLAGDANHDRTVDTLDFNALAANFGGTNKTFSQADFNYDGVVDTLDFNTLAANFGKTLPAPATAIAAAAAAPVASSFSQSLVKDETPMGLPTDSEPI